MSDHAGFPYKTNVDFAEAGEKQWSDGEFWLWIPTSPCGQLNDLESLWGPRKVIGICFKALLHFVGDSWLFEGRKAIAFYMLGQIDIRPFA
ncbi:hypothetical protein DQG23_17650 [Paenibacillus contaminans]|uniref:Uncharacterized protein n=1 Tax=Paenibacillus contaminans TaxID=450362 RepID=A0A329MJ93_9BACL|nr:hypothetical protein DQG23_17650 [Paenibacillus contaminans]